MSKRLSVMDIRELVRQLRQMESDREIQRFGGLHRKTIGRYRQWASEQGLLEGELPDNVYCSPGAAPFPFVLLLDHPRW